MGAADWFDKHPFPKKEHQAGDRAAFLKWIDTLKPDVTGPYSEKVRIPACIPTLLFVLGTANIKFLPWKLKLADWKWLCK